MASYLRLSNEENAAHGVAERLSAQELSSPSDIAAQDQLALKMKVDHRLPPTPPITRRRFLIAGACAGAALAVYSGEIERHWIQISHRDVFLPGLSKAFDGFRIAQLSDIHLDEFTEPFFLRDAVNRVNSLNPDMVVLTGDYVTYGFFSNSFAAGSEWQCANLLKELKCPLRYAALGNHDIRVGRERVTEALTANGIPVLDNAYLPIERNGSRFWLSAVDDPVEGVPDPDKAIPESIRFIPDEPIVLLCHAPDWANNLFHHPAGPAVSLMFSGHTHGGQIRFPLIGPLYLPEFGRRYVEGWFRLNNLLFHVNRGLGTVGVPFRLDCPPEISLITLHPDRSRPLA